MRRPASVLALQATLACAACSSSKEPEKMAVVAQHTQQIEAAVASTTVTMDGNQQSPLLNRAQQAELAQGLATLSVDVVAGTKKAPTVRCMYNCPPPVGSVTAAPQVVSVPSRGMGSTTIHWRWDQADVGALTRYSCLWVSAGEEANAHAVQCERPGHNYATTLHWIGAGTYTFRVAPGTLRGPFTRPIAGIYQFAQATVVGIEDLQQSAACK